MPYVKCRECGGTFHRELGEKWKVYCVPCYKEIKLREKVDLESRVYELEDIIRGQARIIQRFKDKIPKLLKLVHPDRYCNSPLEADATETTQWLLDLRNLKKAPLSAERR